ncbi:MAG: hypothetical protein ABFD96_22735 [Armatimonadia bacterium]
MAKTAIDLQGKDNASRAFQTVTDRLKALRSQIDEINSKGRINLTVSEAGKLKALEREASGLEKSLGGASKATSVFSSALGMLGAVGITASISGIAKLGVALGQLGESAQRSGLYFQAFSGSSEVAAENLKAMQAATGGALTSVQAMQAASKLLSMGLAGNAAELEKVAHMAVMLGGDTRSASEAINEFSLLLANQSILRLDTFGISGARVRERIEELMEANKGLSRETAFMTAVMEEGSAKVKLLEDAGVQAAASTDMLKASVAELKIELSKLVAQPYEVVINWAIPRINEITRELSPAGRAEDEYGRTFQAYKRAVDDVARAEANLGGWYAKINPIARTNYQLKLDGAIAARDLAEANYRAATAALNQATGESSLADSLRDVAAAGADANRVILEGSTLTQDQARRAQAGAYSNALGLGTPEANDALRDFWATYNKESDKAVSSYQKSMESAFNSLASSVQSKLGGAMRSSVGLSDMRTGGSNEPGKNGAFEDIYRLQAWLNDGSWQATADKLGVTSREMGQRIVTDFQNGIFSPDVQKAVNIDQLISQIQIEKAGEESTKAFAAKIAAAAGVSGGQGSSSLSTAFAEGAQTSVNSDDFKARMGDVGGTAWGWTEGGFIRAARQSTALKDAMMAMAEAAVGAVWGRNGVSGAANAGGNP